MPARVVEGDGPLNDSFAGEVQFFLDQLIDIGEQGGGGGVLLCAVLSVDPDELLLLDGTGPACLVARFRHVGEIKIKLPVTGS